jgi:hypothetical protein
MSYGMSNYWPHDGPYNLWLNKEHGCSTALSPERPRAEAAVGRGN